MVVLLLTPPAKPICQHCRLLVVSRPRQLCWTCFNRPGVRESYPLDPVHCRRGVGNICGSLPTAPEPTTARPGSPEKVAVMEARAAGGYAIWHPLDAAE